MNKAIVVLALVFLSSMAAQAQEGGEEHGMGQGMMGGGEHGMGQGMMGGGGYGMSQGMMGGGGYGMGQGMMGGGGYGMGQGMMGGGCGNGMGPGMMGSGYYSHSPECQSFYNESAKLRKELHDKRFEYGETLRNPKAKGEAAVKIAQDIKELQEKIYAKAPLGCSW